MNDPVTPPELLAAKQGTPVQLGWAIPLGEPTPNPALILDPAATPPELLTKGGTPVGLVWNIPLAEPTPDLKSLEEPATPPSLTQKAPTSEPTGSPTKEILLAWDLELIELDSSTPDTPSFKTQATGSQLHSNGTESHQILPHRIQFTRTCQLVLLLWLAFYHHFAH